MYEKGVQTRNHLYEISKRCFYEQGYEKTRIKDIVTAADTPIGLFTYYFKTKDNIVHEIYSDYYQQIDTCLSSLSIEGLDNPILRHAALSYVYFDLILNNENNRRFYYEILRKSSNYRIAGDFIRNTYRAYIKEYDLVISEREFENFLFIDFGGRREYFLNYFKKDLNDSISELVFLLSGIVPRLLGIDQQAVTTLLDKGIEIAESVNCRHIHFLFE
ncbi:TetR/AcrR family transcriptional regulator [uncultured Acetobacterium sp.]|uniref:TetR/AcrR family transcriptional regulator n=1 Tax=uncultured Acetobacterium sp. TaxID=217139 RepID=UPI002420A115|nr:TetR/AcrR family transcriptional regulator [uncultured Acetobacterium sp.]MBU4540477.1 TetR/AcrR family transcriptional regulator [Bacillota bacterium]MDP2843562.1 TetR/AcrR family transcriptional regulator [Acetobacterium sp.]